MRLLREERIIWAHGYVRYWDVFLQKSRETKYCFRCIPCSIIGMDDHSFVVDGPPAYHESN